MRRARCRLCCATAPGRDASLTQIWERYAIESRDGLVLADPIRYPDLELRARRKLLGFIEATLASSRFDPESVPLMFE